MKQAVIKLKTSNAGVLATSFVFRQSLFKSLLGVFGVLAIAYVFIIGSIIFNIVERKNLETEARALESRVAELELEYLSAYKSLDLESSRALGFVETKPNFAPRSALGEESGPKLSRNEI